MPGLRKLLLDIAIGAVIPILILNYLSGWLGAPLAYVVAVLIPVSYILVDTFFISRRFNFIASYVALTAIMTGMLAFWWVDGLRYAIKDSLPALINVLIFGGSVLLHQPILRFFIAQVMNPDTPARRLALDQLLTQPAVARSLVIGTWIMTLDSVMTTGVNFILDLNTVTAPFGGAAFNQQVAQVSIITRGIFPFVSLIGYSIGIGLVFRAMYALFPQQDASGLAGGQFLQLLDKWRERQLDDRR